VTKGLIFHNRAVYTADGMLVGRITEWKVNTFGGRTQVSISVETVPEAADLFNPLNTMLALPPQGAVTRHASVPALFPMSAIRVVETLPDPAPVLNPDGTITEPLSVFSTARQQPRGPLLQGRPNRSEPIGGITHDRQRQAERMLEEYADMQQAALEDQANED